jgi:hypothetical protein
MEYKIRNLVLLEAPNFSEFLMDNFDGEISVSKAMKVRWGFDSASGQRMHESKFYQLKKSWPGIERDFMSPFYDCLIKQINFIPPQSELVGTLKGEFIVYPQFKDKKTSNSPMIYNGFRPGVGYIGKNGVDYISLQYGSYTNLSELADYFKNGFNKKIRGAFWKSLEYKRYDGHKDIPFP